MRQTTPTLIDLTDHPRERPVSLPRRGPLALRYTGRDGRPSFWPRASRGLAEIVLREAGFSVAE